MALRGLCLLLAIAAASSQLGATWPATPAADNDGGLFRRLQQKLGVEPAVATPLTPTRSLSGSGPPSYEDIAQYNIILFVSIVIVVAFYFASMALVNMEHMNDSLLYSKTKSD